MLEKKGIDGKTNEEEFEEYWNNKQGEQLLSETTDTLRLLEKKISWT